jgi:hypothetical protein
MKNFLIIETQYQGHYLTGYIKYVLRSLSKKEYNVVLLITKEANKYAKDALDILKKENNRIIIELIDSIKPKNYTSISLFLYQIKLFFLIKKKFKQINKKYEFSHVFINSFQHFDKIFSILGSPFNEIKFSGVFLGAKFHLHNFNFNTYDRYNFLSKFLFKRLIANKNLLSLIINDELLFKFIKNNYWKNSEKIIFLHDPKEFNYKFDKLYARKKMQLPTKQFLILLYGAIINSKGSIELLNIFKNENINPDVRVVIAGEQIGTMKSYFKREEILKLIKSKKIFIFKGWQNELTESLLFSAADVIWIGYKNYPFPSGVLYQAASRSLPIITSNEGIINWTNKKYGLGLTADIDNTHDIIVQINKLQSKSLYKRFQKKINKFYKIVSPNHWVDSFKKKYSIFL